MNQLKSDPASIVAFLNSHRALLIIVGVVTFGGLFTCCGGLCVLGMILPDPNESSSRPTETTSKQGAGTSPNTSTSKIPEKLTVANGRMPITEFIQYMKFREDLQLHTPDNGTEANGTSLGIVDLYLREACRVHIGGREQHGRNVSAILIEVGKDRQLAAVVLATPYDPTRPVTGNELHSLGYFLNSMLPEADLKAIMRNQGGQLALGNTAKDKFGKASVVVRLNLIAKELMVTIAIDP